VDFLNTAHFQKSTDAVTIDPVVVTEHESRLFSKGHSLFDLKDDPLHTRKSGDVEMKDLAAGMIEKHEDIQDFERQSRNRTEIKGSGFMEMVSDKGKPGLG